jgi:hypothetical protein
MKSGNIIGSVELRKWSEIKSVIDNNPKFEYDHSDSAGIQERVVIVRQSREFAYFHRLKVDSSDYDDYTNNYAAGATRGTDSTVHVSTTFADSFNLDAFSRLRVGSPMSLFDSKQIFGDQALFWEDVTSGSGTSTYRSDESSSRLEVTTTSGDKVIRQTREYFNYQPGKSLRVNMTGVIGGSKTNVRQRLGIFDNDNGIFFEQTGDGLYLVIRSDTSGSPVDNRIAQSNWNIDPLDGTGKSLITMDPTKAQIFAFDIQWLGVGRVRAGFSIDGIIYNVHEELNANNVSTVYMRTPNLPLRYEIENTGTAASNTYMDNICVEAESEGGYNPKGITRIATTGLTAVTVGSSYVPVISIRLKSAYNRAQLLPTNFKIYNSSNTLVHAMLIARSSLTGASFSSVGDNSIAEYDVSASAYSGGEIIDDVFVSSQGANRTQLHIDTPENLLKVVSDYTGTADILTIVGKSDGTTSNIYATLQFREVY